MEEKWRLQKLEGRGPGFKLEGPLHVIIGILKEKGLCKVESRD